MTAYDEVESEIGKRFQKSDNNDKAGTDIPSLLMLNAPLLFIFNG